MKAPLCRLRVWLVAAAAGVALTLGSIAIADTQHFGNRTLYIPNPEEFEPISAAAPRYMRAAGAYLPASNRLIEAYAMPNDVRGLADGKAVNLERYFQLQAPRSVDGTPVSETEFTAAEKEIEAAMGDAIKQTDTGTLLQKGNAEVKSMTATDPKIALSGIGYLGVYRREPWALFFTVRSRVEMPGGGGQELVCAGALALVNYQLVYLYSYSRYRNEGDRQWAESALSSWVDAVRGANPNDPRVGSKADSSVGGFSFSSMFKKGLLGGIIGLVVGLIAMIVRKRPNL